MSNYLDMVANFERKQSLGRNVIDATLAFQLPRHIEQAESCIRDGLSITKVSYNGESVDVEYIKLPEMLNNYGDDGEDE